MFELGRRPRPILKWAGGKKGALKRLRTHFPQSFERYLEPFLGGGAVFLSITKPMPALLNDSNPELIHLYQTVRNEPERLMEELNRLRALYSPEFYYALRDGSVADPVARAARTIFLNKTGYNGLYRLNKKGAFNVPFGKRDRCPNLYDRENLLEVSRRLKAACLFNVDFEELIDQAQAGDFLYCDPPYEPLNATSNFKNYTSKGFYQVYQERLKNACARAVARGALVAISNSASDFIRSLYDGWKVESIPVRRAINSKGNRREPIPEYLILS
jgi:DNA adenine methylase